ncbi:hypothetical protein MasN3_31070 [Massilia varians]|uniref:Uncharacterized protein n=1 Tax=Massilia varians TaxID=457921 RepID=A0ABN6TGB1_9BURK|nr:hypothetical protein MasN3_31070 [Massilia varians]
MATGEEKSDATICLERRDKDHNSARYLEAGSAGDVPKSLAVVAAASPVGSSAVLSASLFIGMLDLCGGMSTEAFTPCCLRVKFALSHKAKDRFWPIVDLEQLRCQRAVSPNTRLCQYICGAANQLSFLVVRN